MDAKSLLRAKKAGARIEHPYASYTSGGLKCSICAIPVTQWEAHILTKQHRASVTREKASQAKSTKRQAEEPLKTEVKKAKIKSTEIQSSILPAGFFDNAAAAVSTPDDGDEDDSPEPAPAPVPTQPKASTSKSAPQQPAKPQPTGDSELDAFLSSLDEPELVDAPATAAASTSASVPRQRNISPGLSMGVASYSAAPVRNIPEQKKDPDEEDEPEPEETEAERRARVEREEREEIMGRLEAEQRAQEDADSRVDALKQRMELLKARREARPSKELRTSNS